ncbi:unnamed protein product, partial [Polarella glacialis]
MKALAASTDKFLTALQEQLAAVQLGLDAARAARSSSLRRIEALQALEAANVTSCAAGAALERAHSDIMAPRHVVSRRRPVVPAESQAGGSSGSDHSCHYSKDSGDSSGSGAEKEGETAGAEELCSPDQQLLSRRAPVHRLSARWALPEDDGARRLSAAVSAVSSSTQTAAAAAFAAAEEV